MTLVINGIFHAYTRLGMAVLATPNPHGPRLAAAIAKAVAKATTDTSTLLPIRANTVAEGITRTHSVGANIPPSPPPYLSPLVSILTSDQLVGLARALATRTSCKTSTSLAIKTAASILDSYLFTNTSGCWCIGTCRSQGLPVCFCRIAPLPESECGLFLLAEI